MTCLVFLCDPCQSCPCDNKQVPTFDPAMLPSRFRPGYRSTSVQMVGFGETFFGVGGPEVAVVLVVGYFVLGPVELVKLVKQAGVLVGQLRDVGLGTVTNLTSIVDDQVNTAVIHPAV